MGAKPLRMWFEKIDGFIKIFDGIRYLVLLASERYNAIYDKIRYLVSENSGITDSINHNFARIRIDSYNSLPIEKTLTFHNVIIFNNSVVNKNGNNYYYNIYLEKGSYEDKSNTYFFKQMLVYYKCYIVIELSQGIDVNKTSESKECNICHYWYFWNKGFKFQPNACNGCHDLLMMSMNFSDIAILNTKSADCCCIISGISKNEAINLVQSIDFTEKTGTL